MGGSEETAVGAATESEGFAVLHVYVCASLLVRWSQQLQKMDFQELVMFLQDLPTSGWSTGDVAELLSQARYPPICPVAAFAISLFLPRRPLCTCRSTTTRPATSARRHCLRDCDRARARAGAERRESVFCQRW